MPDPTTTPLPGEVQVHSPWLTQGYSVTQSLTWEQAFTPLSATSNTLVFPQVWTGTSTGYQVWTSGSTLTMTIPAWGTRSQWADRPWTGVRDRPVEQLPAERGHHMSPIEMGRWLRRHQEQENADAAAAAARWVGTDARTPPPSAEEMEDLEHVIRERAARAQAAAAARRAEMAEADERAEALLRSLLSTEQSAQYEREGAFVMRAPSGRRYRLRRALSGNVDELGPGNTVRDRLCIHPYAECPLADVLICQILMLRTNEAEFRATANHRRVA